jgi:hypothetical protein
LASFVLKEFVVALCYFKKMRNLKAIRERERDLTPTINNFEKKIRCIKSIAF